MIVTVNQYVEKLPAPCRRFQMKRNFRLFLAVLCLGSVFWYIQTSDIDTHTAIFLGQIKKQVSSFQDIEDTRNEESWNKPFNLVEVATSDENLTDVSEIGMKIIKLMKDRKEQLNVKRNSSVLPEDLMTAGPFKFLPNYKNPCWLNPDRVDDQEALPVLCLPYFYMLGAPKAGTTDMNHRLTQHPQISSNVPKEPHWLTRKFITSSLCTLKDYSTLYFTKGTIDLIQNTDETGYHNMVFGDSSASTLWDNYYLSKHPAIQNLTELPYTNADILHNLNPHTKFIVMIRNPITRLYSDFLYFHHGTPREFHDEVTEVLQLAYDCFSSYSMRHCVYKEFKDGKSIFRRIRLQIGIYYLHLEEYFRVFPRDQVMPIKLEDFSVNTADYLKKLFAFLDLDPVDDELLETIADPEKKANTRSERDKNIGEMLPETRKLLEEFYRPFNEKLVRLLGDSFNYNE